jgi:beta-glucosidase
MKKPLILALIILSFSFTDCQPNRQPNKETTHAFANKIDSLLSLMTLDEKIGQLNQLTGNGEVTGPVTLSQNYQEAIRNGQVGSMLNVNGAAYTYKIQKIAVEESRLGIPLIFGYDVIHGYKTIFPIPLGESASWDLEAIEQSARVAAVEAAAAGQHWTFAPMVDIARDPRWGRIMEGAGEDPYLGSQIARARVRGFQGNDLSENNTIMACAKHFMAYGAAEAGRDYNTVDMSKRRLHEVYLPPFKAAVDEGVATIMTSFNEFNGIPMTGNKVYVNELLRHQWNFNGIVVSDWGSIAEMITHGAATDRKDAAEQAMNASVDMDMEGHAYLHHLKELVSNGVISQNQIDQAVKRILEKKFELGLFEDPYRYCDIEREATVTLSKKHRSLARESARKSMILLKNDHKTLPFSKNVKTIAVIGPLGESKVDMIGTWNARGEGKDAVSLVEGISNVVPDARILYAKGCETEGTSTSEFNKALQIAQKADIVIAAVGERAMMSGEALSRQDIRLPGMQEALVKKLASLKKPMAVVLFNGRPLVITEVAKVAPAILESWLAGTEAGNAIADVLFGDYNPSGKLPVTFPYSLGQVPVYYAHKNTGRPRIENSRYTSKYIDGPNKPLYPFGYGLSYTSFSYNNLLVPETMSGEETLLISVDVTNTGEWAGEEVVQLYINDSVASVTRPVKALKKFKKILLQPGKTQTVQFELTTDDLAFYNRNWKWVAEPGYFTIFVGGNSENTLSRDFQLVYNNKN